MSLPPIVVLSVCFRQKTALQVSVSESKPAHRLNPHLVTVLGIGEVMQNIRDFRMKPKEVKEYLDRFVIEQDGVVPKLSHACSLQFDSICETGK